MLLSAGSCQDGGTAGQTCVEHPEVCPSGQSCNLVSLACEPLPPGPAPSLTGISPALGPSAGGVTLELTGQGFVASATVSIDGIDATQVDMTAITRLMATLPAHLGALGRVPVVVRNPDSQMSSRSDLFTYFASLVAFPAPIAFIGPNPFSMARGDFNGDGKPDFAVANLTGSVGVLLGNGMGGFAPQVSFAAGNSPRAVAVGDVNGD